MITPAHIEEWLREIEERPASAELIIRQIASRLGELDDSQRSLSAENIALRSGERVAEYEQRIANLEYQLELLSRQVGAVDIRPVSDTLSLLIYNGRGQVLRLGLDEDEFANSKVYANFVVGEIAIDDPPQFLVVDPQEELLFVFDSGRVVNRPAADIQPAVITHGIELDWAQAFSQEPRGGERLAAILPIARMTLNDYCVQVSRRGYVKKIRESFLESCISRSNVGSGVILPSDRTYKLALCNPDDKLILVSQEGQLLVLDVNQLPFTIEQVYRLAKADHIVSAFIPGEKPSFLAITQNGKIFHRQISWLDLENASKMQKKAILTKARREAGMCIVAAAAVALTDWSLILTSDGRIRFYQVDELFALGALLDRATDNEVISFTTF